MPSTRRARVRSFAKINLDLRVLNRRPDGYHELRTIFQTVSLADTIDIEFTPGRKTAIRIHSAADIPNNLIVQAAELVMGAGKAKGSLEFHLKKRIPMGGGLGGGSSNAAAVLLALPVLIGQHVPIERLMDLGAQLGSDVPFFLYGGTALGLGRGTEIYPALEPAPKPAILVTPGIHVSTAEAYKALGRELTSELPSAILRSFQATAWRSGQSDDWEAINDFEAVVFSQHPQLKSIQRKLLNLGAKPALMSGSGSTLFGIFDNIAKRNVAISELGNRMGYEWIHKVSTISRSKYRSLWRRQLASHSNPDRNWPPRSRYVT